MNTGKFFFRYLRTCHRFGIINGVAGSVLGKTKEIDVFLCNRVESPKRVALCLRRLRTIQSKLEVRISIAGSEWDEVRRLDLTTKVLRMEGELSIRNDSNKKMTVLVRLCFPSSPTFVYGLRRPSINFSV